MIGSRARSSRLVPFLALAMVGCGESTTGPHGDEAADDDGVLVPISGDAVAGVVAFETACASCHATRDGLDLALFSFRDTTIVRRALDHVDVQTAHDIVAYLRTISVRALPEDSRPFQPGGTPLAGDLEFALALFGADAWPDSLTTAQLRAIDPTRTETAVPFPIWSVEQDNRDWMPAGPLPPDILGFVGGRAQRAIDTYYGAPSTATLAAAIAAIGLAERDPANPTAPCVLEPFERYRPVECFEVRRWAATLGAQHMLRRDLSEPVHPYVHGMWWNLGSTARLTQVTVAARNALENGLDNWVSWMWIGWAFNPGEESSSYLADGLVRQGLWRHALFHVLRTAVAREPGSVLVYLDVRNAARAAPLPWLENGLVFGLTHLIERLDAGDVPMGERRAEALSLLGQTIHDVALRLPESELGRIRELHAEVVGRVQ